MAKMNMTKMNTKTNMEKININPGKKCIPGLFCVGNMTLFMFCIMSLFIVFLLYRQNEPNVIVITQPPFSSSSFSLGNNKNNDNDTLSNAYLPPLRNNNPSLTPKPVPDTNYQQIGILTRSNNNNNHNEILPLMGKRKMTSRYKWQYYTISSGHGNLQTKLPISVKGKSCTGEYGCDEIYNNDTVYVEGFKDVFVATIYENNTFEYIP
jgi:hypothetical protein